MPGTLVESGFLISCRYTRRTAYPRVGNPCLCSSGFVGFARTVGKQLDDADHAAMFRCHRSPYRYCFGLKIIPGNMREPLFRIRPVSG